ncbi:MAG: GspE/PulE family protein [Sporomusaceae bacterium]|jgi:type IV pilus assembly protein PilB|nr:GspE/PulE family protein [Sporomusaceae bacterium]
MRKFPKINLAEISIEKKTATLIPLALAERHTVIPVKLNGKKLVLAMREPVDYFAIDDVRLVSGYEVEPVLAAAEDILRAVRQLYEVDYAETAPEEKSAAELETANDAPIINTVNSIISQAVKNRASDIHLEPQENYLRIRFRIDGVLKEAASFPAQISAALISRIKIMSQLDIAEKRQPQDGRIVVSAEIDLRVSTMPTIWGEKVVMRILNKQAVILDLEKLGFTAANLACYQTFYNRAYGIVLITGPTGSGKTTTLYSTLEKINSTDKNVVTIEDPVEYRIQGANQIQTNAKANLTFASGLRSILRQDPDIIMVGEIRDGETADVAIRAALTGHLVFSTLHTNDAPGALNRLLDMGVEAYLVSAAVLGVVAQRLVRVLCPKCKAIYSPDSTAKNFLAKIGRSSFLTDNKNVFYQSAGCGYCYHTGYYGRMAIHEVMPLSPTMISALHDRASSSVIAAIAAREGMTTMVEDGLAKVCQGLTTIDEVMRVSL